MNAKRKKLAEIRQIRKGAAEKLDGCQNSQDVIKALKNLDWDEARYLEVTAIPHLDIDVVEQLLTEHAPNLGHGVIGELSDDPAMKRELAERWLEEVGSKLGEDRLETPDLAIKYGTVLRNMDRALRGKWLRFAADKYKALINNPSGPEYLGMRIDILMLLAYQAELPSDILEEIGPRQEGGIRFLFELLTQPNTTEEMIERWMAAWDEGKLEEILWGHLAHRSIEDSSLVNKLPEYILLEAFLRIDANRPLWRKLGEEKRAVLIKHIAPRRKEEKVFGIIEDVSDILSVEYFSAWGKEEIKSLLLSDSKELRIIGQKRLGVLREGVKGDFDTLGEEALTTSTSEAEEMNLRTGKAPKVRR